MNKCILIGNLTRDPELTETPSGIAVCKFSIAVNRSYANANGEREADFINIVTWRGLAENCGKYLFKGDKVAVSGSIQTRTYEDRNGDTRYVTEIVADNVEFLTPHDKDAGEPKRAAQTAKKKTSDLKPIEDDGLPF